MIRTKVCQLFFRVLAQVPRHRYVTEKQFNHTPGFNYCVVELTKLQLLNVLFVYVAGTKSGN